MKIFLMLVCWFSLGTYFGYWLHKNDMKKMLEKSQYIRIDNKLIWCDDIEWERIDGKTKPKKR